MLIVVMHILCRPMCLSNKHTIAPGCVVQSKQKERAPTTYHLGQFGVKAKRVTSSLRPPAVWKAIWFVCFFLPLPTNRMQRHKEDKWRGFSESRRKSSGHSGTHRPVWGHGGLIDWLQWKKDQMDYLLDDLLTSYHHVKKKPHCAFFKRFTARHLKKDNVLFAQHKNIVLLKLMRQI